MRKMPVHGGHLEYIYTCECGYTWKSRKSPPDPCPSCGGNQLKFKASIVKPPRC